MLQPIPGVCDVYKHVFKNSNGSLHKITTGNDSNLGPCIQFDNDDLIQIPEPGMFVKGCELAPGILKAAFLGHDTDKIYYLYDDGEVIDATKQGKGKNPFAWDHTALLHVQEDTNFPNYASEGIHHINPDGTIVMNNDPSLFGEMHGMKLHHIDRDGDFIVAVVDKFVNAGVCLITPTHIYYYNQSTSNPPYIVHAGGIIWVAVQGSQWRNTFDPEFPVWDVVEEIGITQPPIPPTIPPVSGEIVFNIPGPIQAGQVIKLVVT
jgi:hypothetical protein